LYRYPDPTGGKPTKKQHMKIIYPLIAASFFFLASCGPTTVIVSDPNPPAPVEEVSYQSFYDQLSPYGNWINYPGYGYVWSPNVGPDFQPYATNGNWIYTDAGWTWASDYNWGWAPFHYGRWFYENSYGWMWVPGNEWAPAWVSWRGGGDYYGWAPLGPSVSAEVALSNYNPPANYWNFVPRQYMGNPGWHSYYVSGARNVTIINNTTIINNYSGTNRAKYNYAPGPDPNEVRRYSGNNFTPVQLRQANTPGARVSGSQYQIYQPRVSAAPVTRETVPGRAATPAPARYEPFNKVRPSAQYPAYNPPAAGPTPAAAARPAYNPPPNNAQPANNPRPAYNPPPNNAQPANNPRPAYNPPPNNTSSENNPRPGNNLPNNNAQPAPAQPGRQAYNAPDNNPRPPANNTSPNSPRPANTHPQSVPENQTANRVNPNNQPVHSTPHPVQSGPGHPATAANHPQPAGHPIPARNPNNGQPQPKPATPDNKPQEHPAVQPKTRDANTN
jgi:hypothetical protein